MDRTSTPFRVHVTPAIALLAVAINAIPGQGQPSEPDTPAAVQQASLDGAAAARQTVQFGRRASRVGDEVEQTLSLEMRLATSLRQGNELIESNQSVVRTAQRRVVATSAVEQDRTTAVLVRYVEASKELTASASADTPMPAPQSVQGKSYHCQRGPGDEGKLIVTDAEGHVPPPEEYEIVATNMEMVGRVNPLAQFLAGRTVAVGETIDLPKKLADQLFNLGDRFGNVTRFDLKLEKVEAGEGGQHAVFLAHVEAASNDSSQMRMQVEGPLVVQVDTCRAVRLALSGPIAMAETRGSYSTTYQLIGTGQLSTSIASAYRDAQR